ncbi:MAG TPA: cytochrome P450 [Casimicrobiaceae bacterium]|nr:cytochrome P450 [Casimicrobiaceae bacterium]
MPASAAFAPDRAREIAQQFDLADLPAAFYADPYPYYRALREREPVRRMPDGSIFLTRYDDILPVYRDPKAFSSDKKKEFGPKYGPSPLLEHHTTSLVFNDPPLHTRVRRAIVGALSQRHIAAMEPGLVALVDRLLDRLAQRGNVDAIDEYAGAIPVEIIGNLLRVPHEERGPLRGWSLAILGALEPVLTPQRAKSGNRAVIEMLDYLRTLVADRRRRPDDPDTDVLTRLIQGESDGERLTETELLHQCIFLLNAGHETTTNLIGNALYALLDWPDQKRRLIAQPDLITSAVEEFLRFESSNQLGNRITTRDVAVGGVALGPDTRITMCIGAANRDPAQFADPDRLDVARDPNRHIAFGSGIHTCAGLNLARLEGRVAIGRFLARFPDYALDGDPVRGGRARFRGFLHLPVRVG